MGTSESFHGSKEAALPPGTLVHVGQAPAGEIRLRVLRYDEETCDEKDLSEPRECLEMSRMSGVTWIEVTGIHDVEFIKTLGSLFGIHPLVLEDIVHAKQRPKFEDHEDYLYFVLTSLTYVRAGGELRSEQLSIVAGKGFVLTFLEKERDTFDPLRERIRAARGRIRRMGADYLTYALIDTVVDHYFIAMERFGEKIEREEEKILANHAPQTMAAVHRMKRRMISVRKSTWPLRDAVGQILRGESSLITEETDIYYRDVHDHLLRIIDTVETYRDMLSGLTDIHLSSVSNRMNEVMKTLTIMASIFIPLTFIAGVYGMNFENMPELGWRGGYFAVLGVMAAVGLGMVVYFRRKKWL